MTVVPRVRLVSSPQERVGVGLVDLVGVTVLGVGYVTTRLEAAATIEGIGSLVVAGAGVCAHPVAVRHGRLGCRAEAGRDHCPQRVSSL